MARFPLQRYLVWAGILFFLLGFRWFWFAGDKTWQGVDEILAKKYPDVEHISTEKLQSLYAAGVRFSLFDIRTEEEFAVSHLAGAVRSEDAATVELPKDTYIIAYCAVGIRSAGFIDMLRQRGYTRVFNLEGSIFKWANRGYTLVKADGAVTSFVHPYDSWWGVLLDPKLHRYEKNDNGGIGEELILKKNIK